MIICKPTQDMYTHSSQSSSDVLEGIDSLSVPIPEFEMLPQE